MQSVGKRSVNVPSSQKSHSLVNGNNLECYMLMSCDTNSIFIILIHRRWELFPFLLLDLIVDSWAPVFFSISTSSLFFFCLSLHFMKFSKWKCHFCNCEKKCIFISCLCHLCFAANECNRKLYQQFKLKINKRNDNDDQRLNNQIRHLQYLAISSKV